MRYTTCFQLQVKYLSSALLLYCSCMYGMYYSAPVPESLCHKWSYRCSLSAQGAYGEGAVCPRHLKRTKIEQGQFSVSLEKRFLNSFIRKGCVTHFGFSDNWGLLTHKKCSVNFYFWNVLFPNGHCLKAGGYKGLPGWFGAFFFHICRLTEGAGRCKAIWSMTI